MWAVKSMSGASVGSCLQDITDSHRGQVSQGPVGETGKCFLPSLQTLIKCSRDVICGAQCSTVSFRVYVSKWYTGTRTCSIFSQIYM